MAKLTGWDLSLIPSSPQRVEYITAVDAIRERDGRAFAMAAYSNDCMFDFVLSNFRMLRTHGMAEAATMEAFSGCKTNHSRMPSTDWITMFLAFDRDAFRACGDPLPDAEKFRVYRGVAGRGRLRSIRGLSWTLNRDVACWFARRYATELPNPAVYSVTVSKDEVYFAWNGRDEEEIVCWPNRRPRQVKMTVDELVAAADRFTETKEENLQKSLRELTAGVAKKKV